MATKQADPVGVLIVGGGPVGLALTIELGLKGVDCLLVEQRDGEVRVPKMSQVSSRSMEICRSWGIADEVRGAVWSSTHPLDFVYLDNLIGREVGRVKLPSYQARGQNDYSPEGPCTCPQIFFDPILAAKAKTVAGVSLRYNTRLVSFEQTEALVQARLVDTLSGEEEIISAHYMVGCDGPSGHVRQALDIPLDGLRIIANSINIYFRSPDLISIHDKGWARFYRTIDEDGCWAELIAIDGRELWRLGVFHDPSPEIDADAYLRKLAGREFEYELLDVSPWERRDYVASTYRRGRVMIAGDAAHQCSPTGGLGMHTGIAEAVNLAWKLTALLNGWGGPGLLDSYEAECRPIAKYLVDYSNDAFNSIAALPGLAGIHAALADQDVLLSLTVPERIKTQYCYVDSPICAATGPNMADDTDPFSGTIRPGGRAPHGWLAEGKSTIDLFSDKFVLLRFLGATDGLASFAAAAKQRAVPLEIIDIEQTEIAASFGRRFALVRPDSHLAWLGDEFPSPAGAILDLARGA